MDDTLQQSECGDEERFISTIEELSNYLKENRQVAATLVRAIGDQAASDGPSPIEDILEKGYEDSFYLDDSMNLDEEFKTIVMTPNIETATDWDQPFDDHDFGIGIQDLLDGTVVAEELASEFDHRLLRVCLNLVEERGKSKPNSGFVDIFGQKVYEVFQPKLEEKRAQARQTKLEGEQEIERKRERLRLLDQLLEDRLEFERQFEQRWWPEFRQQLVSDLRDPWDSLHHWLTEQRLELERLQELQQTRYRDLYEDQRELEDEDPADAHEILREILGESIEEAVPIIAAWMKETIEAEGESLVFEALKGMSP